MTLNEDHKYLADSVQALVDDAMDKIQGGVDKFDEDPGFDLIGAISDILYETLDQLEILEVGDESV